MVAPDGTAAWGIGALRNRLVNLQAGQEIEANWPKPSEQFETACKGQNATSGKGQFSDRPKLQSTEARDAELQKAKDADSD